MLKTLNSEFLDWEDTLSELLISSSKPRQHCIWIVFNNVLVLVIADTNIAHE